MRVKAVLSYDGSFFRGFQKQKNTRHTITTALESALHALRIDTAVVGSGRTDAGVHATGQIIHFDLPEYWYDLHKLHYELDRRLKHIRIKHITPVTNSFHARFSAKKRIYRYVFKRKKPSLFEEKYIAHYKDFNPILLRQALQQFEGTHDFRYFHKTGSDTHTTVRTIHKTRYRQQGDYYMLYFEADGFLRAQVRMMIDAAMRCAISQLTPEMLQEQIEYTHRYTTSLAPPSGLYLARILY
jgi:tRNA pseudouridine38-40 synthase